MAQPSVVVRSRLVPLATFVTEAMLVGCSVVAHAVGGLPEMVEDGLTGFLTPPNDPQVLARRINEVLADPERAAAMGRAAQHKAADWTPARAAETLETLYRRALAEYSQ